MDWKERNVQSAMVGKKEFDSLVMIGGGNHQEYKKWSTLPRVILKIDCASIDIFYIQFPTILPQVTSDTLSLHLFHLQYLQYQKGVILICWKQFHNPMELFYKIESTSNL